MNHPNNLDDSSRSIERGSAVYMRNLALTSMVGQAGCATLVVILAALFAGLYLDSRLDTRPLFTLGLLLISIPISLYSMVWLMMSAIGSLKLENPYAVREKTAAHTKKEDGS
ncbi:MAG: AtpZ/AtpI family protein [Anaerolineae bacterium]|nr:AtpZ/AtpI family protein [Anaerolineae bacterium]